MTELCDVALGRQRAPVVCVSMWQQFLTPIAVRQLHYVRVFYTI